MGLHFVPSSRRDNGNWLKILYSAIELPVYKAFTVNNRVIDLSVYSPVFVLASLMKIDRETGKQS